MGVSASQDRLSSKRFRQLTPVFVPFGHCRVSMGVSAGKRERSALKAAAPAV